MPIITHNPEGEFPPYRGHCRATVRQRVKYLRDHRTSSTVVCCWLLDLAWKLEIEAMAAMG